VWGRRRCLLHVLEGHLPPKGPDPHFFHTFQRHFSAQLCTPLLDDARTTQPQSAVKVDILVAVVSRCVPVRMATVISVMPVTAAPPGASGPKQVRLAAATGPVLKTGPAQSVGCQGGTLVGCQGGTLVRVLQKQPT